MSQRHGTANSSTSNQGLRSSPSGTVGDGFASRLAHKWDKNKQHRVFAVSIPVNLNVRFCTQRGGLVALAGMQANVREQARSLDASTAIRESETNAHGGRCPIVAQQRFAVSSEKLAKQIGGEFRVFNEARAPAGIDLDASVTQAPIRAFAGSDSHVRVAVPPAALLDAERQDELPVAKIMNDVGIVLDTNGWSPCFQGR